MKNDRQPMHGPNTTDEIIELVRAYDNDRPDFEAAAIPNGAWVDIFTTTHPIETWDFRVLRYRIKPKSNLKPKQPRVFWINMYPWLGTTDDTLYDSESNADDAARPDCLECIKLVESFD